MQLGQVGCGVSGVGRVGIGVPVEPSASVLPPVGLKVGSCDDGIGVGALLGDDVNVGDAVGS